MTEMHICEKEKLDIDKSMVELLEESYKHYIKLINNPNLKFNDKKVYFSDEKDWCTMKYHIYEHIISHRTHMGGRVYDKNRLVLIPLIEKILTYCCNNECENIKVLKENNDVLIWCKSLDFLIVLTKIPEGYMFKTAYPVFFDDKRDMLENDIKRKVKKKKH